MLGFPMPEEQLYKKGGEGSPPQHVVLPCQLDSVIYNRPAEPGIRLERKSLGGPLVQLSRLHFEFQKSDDTTPKMTLFDTQTRFKTGDFKAHF